MLDFRYNGYCTEDNQCSGPSSQYSKATLSRLARVPPRKSACTAKVGTHTAKAPGYKDDGKPQLLLLFLCINRGLGQKRHIKSEYPTYLAQKRTCATSILLFISTILYGSIQVEARLGGQWLTVITIVIRMVHTCVGRHSGPN